MPFYVPQRNDICWIDLEPTKGKEIGKRRPVLVLSSYKYNKLSGMIICTPISTSIRYAPTEVPVTNLKQLSVVATTIIQTVDYQQRNAEFIIQAEDGLFTKVLDRIIPLIGGEHLLKD